MASCSFTFSAPPTLGILCALIRHIHQNKSSATSAQILQENHWSLRQVFSFLVGKQQMDNFLPSKPLDSKNVQFPHYQRPVTVLGHS